MTHTAESSSLATLVIVRKSPRDLQQREVHVYVDGERVGVLAYGRKLRRQLTPGPHRLKVYNTLVSKSIDVALDPGQTYTFATGNEAAGCLMGWLMLVGAGPMAVFIERVPEADEAAAFTPEAASAGAGDRGASHGGDRRYSADGG